MNIEPKDEIDADDVTDEDLDSVVGGVISEPVAEAAAKPIGRTSFPQVQGVSHLRGLKVD